MKKTVITILCTILIICTMLIFQYVSINSVYKVKTHTIEKTDIVSSIVSDGKVEEVIKKDLFVDVPVKVKDIKIKEGDTVKKGQTLMQLDISNIETELNQTESSLEVEKLNYEKLLNQYNYKDFINDDSIYKNYGIEDVWKEQFAQSCPNQELIDIQKKRVEMEELKLDELKEKIKNQVDKIVSPINGVITELNVKSGRVANTLQPAVVVSNIEQLQIRANIGEYYISRIKQNQEVEITGDAFENETYKGKVSKIFPVAKEVLVGQSMKTVVDVIIDIIDKNTKLKPGYSVQAKVITDTKKDVLVVPYEAIIQDDDNNDIAFVVENNRAYKRKIKIGEELEFEVEVLEGLKEGEQVIINPSKEMKNNMKVKKVI